MEAYAEQFSERFPMPCVSEPNAPKSALVPSATPNSPHHVACQTPKVLQFFAECFYIKIVTAIIHAVGPTVPSRQVKDEHREDLGNCYQRALYEAVSAGLRSIVTPNSIERFTISYYRRSHAFLPESTGTQMRTLRMSPYTQCKSGFRSQEARNT